MNSALVLASLVTAAHPNPAMPKEHPVQVAVVCFKSGEQISGMNKICYYNCLGSQAAITIGAVELCPLSIDR